MTPRRPPVRYHGSKFRIAAKIIEHFPAHRIYVEPFGGGAGVLMKKERSFAEVYNDLDTDIVNVFRVMQDLDKAERLRRLIELTPWSRDEFMLAYEPTDDQVERARRTIARSFMAFGSTSRRANRTGFRAKAYRQNQTGPMDWRTYPEQIVFFVDRLRGVTIENRDALKIIAQQDSVDTLFYCDPPYVHSVRSSLAHKGGSNDSGYAHELTDDDHRQLADVLRKVDGMVILSGYPSPLYDDELFPDWRRISFSARADGAVEREEVLWISPNAERRGRPLFSIRAECAE
ncbi:MAG: DNA adenine methylase [Bradyrhizobium sp.]|uniref:DNA adenine methylase n=1 Tax=Bradyrhizobium sp. TaxID=376 RepID=UPI0029A01B47|nr:DNA adenine methylase [Bradyrhizobium sp.]MDX3971144.1 DNA adenine methylase [Bradyrhizobium sp.]